MDTIIKGDHQLGYFGLVNDQDFITGRALQHHLNLHRANFSLNNIGWLKFAFNNRELYVAKKCFIYNLSWELIYQAGAVYGTDDYGENPSGYKRVQNAQITINDQSFRITLLTGHSSKATEYTKKDQLSEWEQLMYRVCKRYKVDDGTPGHRPIPFEDFDSFSLSELGIGKFNGGSSWCQEAAGATWCRGNQRTPDHRVFRGMFGIDFAHLYHAKGYRSYIGWRPALRGNRPIVGDSFNETTPNEERGIRTF